MTSGPDAGDVEELASSDRRRRRLVLASTVVVLLACVVCVVVTALVVPTHRKARANTESIGKVEVGMDVDELPRLIGDPDEIQTLPDGSAVRIYMHRNRLGFGVPMDNYYETYHIVIRDRRVERVTTEPAGLYTIP